MPRRTSTSSNPAGTRKQLVLAVAWAVCVAAAVFALPVLISEHPLTPMGYVRAALAGALIGGWVFHGCRRAR